MTRKCGERPAPRARAGRTRARVGHQAQHDVADGTFELLQRVGSLKQALLVGIFMRTPLRWVLTGPDRTAERARFPVYPAAARVPEATAVATASAMAR